MDNQRPKKNKEDDSFWALDNGYMKTVKRTEDGRKMCKFLRKMIDERAAVEKNYAVRLNKWYLKWMKRVDKSSEYGSTKEMMKKSLTEADRMSEVHQSIRDNLTNITHAKVKNYRKENYSYQVCMSKPASAYKKNFEKAQKPWKFQSKKLEALQRELTVKATEANTLLANQPDPTGYNQWKENCDLLLRQVDNSKERVKVAENELTQLKETYVTDMNNVFASAQDFEARRLEFFKEVLAKFHDALRLSKDNSTVNDVYHSCMESISRSNPRNDVKTWSSVNGPEGSFVDFMSKDINAGLMTSLDERRKGLSSVAMVVPVVTKPSNQAVTATVTTTAATTVASGMNKGFTRESSAQQRLDNPDFESEFDLDSVDLNTGGGVEGMSKASTLEVRPIATKASTSASGLPDYDSALYSTLNEDGITEGVAGGVGSSVKVKALYDYQGKEEDEELTFKKGDQFEMVRDKDDNGWATGRINGRVGLFPDSYVKPV